MFLDIIPTLETGVSARFPKARHALRIFLIFRASPKTSGTPSGGYTLPAAAAP